MCGRTPNNRPTRTDKRGIDWCLSPFVRLLNRKGVETLMSCCEHFTGSPWVVMRWSAFAALLRTRAWQWIEEAHRSDHTDIWKVTFFHEVCTPPRLAPCRNLTRGQVREQRKAFGFKRP